MKLPIAFGPFVDDDIDEVTQHFLSVSLPTAKRFVRSLSPTLTDIANWPGAGSLKFAKHRKLKAVRSWQIKGFRRYLILYHVTPDQIKILAIIHGARDLRRLLRARLP